MEMDNIVLLACRFMQVHHNQPPNLQMWRNWQMNHQKVWKEGCRNGKRLLQVHLGLGQAESWPWAWYHYWHLPVETWDQQILLIPQDTKTSPKTWLQAHLMPTVPPWLLLLVPMNLKLVSLRTGRPGSMLFRLTPWVWNSSLLVWTKWIPLSHPTVRRAMRKSLRKWAAALRNMATTVTLLYLQVLSFRDNCIGLTSMPNSHACYLGPPTCWSTARLKIEPKSLRSCLGTHWEPGAFICFSNTESKFPLDLCFPLYLGNNCF